MPIFPLDVRQLVSNVWLIAAAGMALLVLLAACARRLLRGVPGGSFFALWPLIAILPVLPVAPGQRFLYLPSVGFCAAAALAVEHAWDRSPREGQRRLRFALGGAFLATLALATANQAVWGVPGQITRDLVADVRGFAPTLPRGSEIYLVNLWSPAVRLPDILRLEYGDPDLQVQILSCSPKSLPLHTGPAPHPIEGLFGAFVPSGSGVSQAACRWLDGTTLSVWSGDERYGQTLTESILPTLPFPAGTVVRAQGFTARVTAADGRGI